MSGASGPNSCVNQDLVLPVISSTVTGQLVYGRLRAVSVNMGQVATVQWTMTTPAGDPVDLTSCIDATFQVRIREVLSFGPQDASTIIAVDVIDAPNGIVQAVLTSDVVAAPGISYMEWGVLDLAGNLLFSNLSYLVVNRGQYGGVPGGCINGPPTLAEIRLHLRDSDPADNLWLGIQEFDMAEIAACIQRPIDYFNESRPPLHQRFNTANFPYRYFWLEGIIANLYKMAALHYTRVHLPYQQQGGLMVDDKNKAEQYLAIAKEKWDEYKDWVLRTKVGMNAMGAIQSIISPYSGYPWGRGL